ncbi:biopolymer transporter ExbD [Sphingopyxis sp. BSNA05]|uniref:ExbD/TolR family protein n=1 Tax=Sphingomonadales TaxID=204457 RepID=UPI000C1F0D67|nr:MULTISPECIES: biopolymer transporter ExbD [Sphingomonadaceae]ATW03689.1 biopolymer transporter ExbD [Sphingorhabdus sp. YGSMI21]NRD90691.1 biopolymer transporter ExbD [Sphingopyxis sp. BSNA05]
MAMNVGGGSGEETPLSDINTTPLVDVMLVLLIIFLIAVPVVIQTVELELPVLPFEVTTTKKENVLLSITTTDAAGRDPGEEGYSGATPGGNCRVYWGTSPVDSNELVRKAVKQLEDQIESFGGVENMTPEDMPEVHIRGDINTPYKCIGGAIYSMQRAGFAKVGFISTPIAVE